MSEIYKVLHLIRESEDAEVVEGILETGDIIFSQVVVETKQDFLTAFENFEPEIVLVQDGVPSLSLFLALEIHKDLGSRAAFIGISTNTSVEYAVNLLKNGADDYILRNTIEQLSSAIPNALEKIRKASEKQDLVQETVSRERKFRRLIEHGNDPVIIFTPESETLYISPAAERTLGYTEEDLDKLQIKSIIHPEDLPVASHYMSLCIENPGASIGTMTGKVKHKDGSWRWMEATFTNLLHDEDVKGIVNNFKDINDHKLAELAIKESEERYRSFFENSMDAILLTHPDGQVFAANPAACEIFQRTEEEMIKVGRAGVLDMLDPSVVKAISERKNTGKFKGELMMLRKNGVSFPAEVSSEVFKNDAGQERSSIIIRDISERKQVEEELRFSKENYQHLFHFNPLPNWIYDLETLSILDVNQAAIEHYGYTKEEFLQLNLVDLRPKEEIPGLLRDLERIKRDRGNLGYGKFVHKKKDDSRITVEIHGYGIRFQNKECRLITCVDVTEVEAVMLKLRKKSEKLLLAEKLAKLGYWEVGLQENYFFWSEEVYRIWEQKKDEFQVSRNVFEETIHPDDLEKFRSHQEEAFKGVKELDFEHRIILPGGSIKWVHERGKVINDKRGLPLRFEGSVQDITAHKNALEKLTISEARHRGILKSQTNYLTRIDLDGRYSYVNDKFHKDFSWIFPDFILVGKEAESTAKEHHHEKVQDIFRKCLKNPNDIFQVELDKLKQDGGVKSTLWDFVCLTDVEGEPLEVQGVGVDISERVKAEQSLLESNTRYELVSKATSDAIYDWDVKSGYLFWGEAFYSLFGYPQEGFTLTVDAWLSKIHPEDSSRIKKSLEEVIKGTENHWKAEYRFKKADGKYSFVIEKSFILRDENLKAIRLVGAIRDVTEKKKLEELLDEASRFARIGSFEFDFENKGNTLYWSPVTKEIHEVEKDYEPTLETGILFYKEGEHRDKMYREFEKAVEHNIPYDLELKLITAKGNERWVRKIGKPTFVDGKCVRISGSFQDITKIKRSELAALKASEEKEIILESIGDAFYAVDQNWIFTYFNKHAEKLLNVAKEEVVGKNIWEVFSDVLDTSFFTKYHQAVRQQEIIDFEEYFDRVNKWFSVSAYPSSTGLSVYFRDVTERKNSELEILELNRNLQAHTDELVEANKGLEQFSFIVSHNLRSPVANILGLADLIGSEDYPQEVKENFLKELLNNVQRLDTVIIDLNDILQVKMEMDSKKEPVILDKLVNSIKSSIHNLIEKENVQISTDFEVARLQTVQSYLYSIFYNLIANSIKYRRPGITPEIKISSERKDSGISLIFEDNGLGIDISKKGEQVFGLYKRFHYHVEGKGMGLFLVKTQVQLLGGKISVESRVNEGTRFIITFKEEATNLIFEDEKDISLYGG
ncbi:PAS domain S-box protein [Salinimicrobium marinum]|nr:PAS domain S-box protein [Salinimicrobium marinum]